MADVHPADHAFFVDHAESLRRLGFARIHATSYPNYFVAAVACTPSRSTLLTGLYPQQTCMFATEDSAAAPALQPYDGGNGFATIGDVLSQQLNNSGMQMLNIYDTAWIGKWHVSDLVMDGLEPHRSERALGLRIQQPFQPPHQCPLVAIPEPLSIPERTAEREYCRRQSHGRAS